MIGSSAICCKWSTTSVSGSLLIVGLKGSSLEADINTILHAVLLDIGEIALPAACVTTNSAISCVDPSTLDTKGHLGGALPNHSGESVSHHLIFDDLSFLICLLLWRQLWIIFNLRVTVFTQLIYF
jgi:hypothetical protein